MAARRENLGPAAPIVEALVDIQVGLPTDTTVDSLRGLGARLGDRFPTPRPRHRWEGVFDPAKADAPRLTESHLLDGWLFYSRDEKKVVQFRLDGFTFNQLRPYHDWPTMKAEARTLWSVYREGAKPTEIRRLALRYINRLRLPVGQDLDVILAVGPRVPPGLPQVLGGFFHRIQVPIDSLNALAVITLTSEAREGLDASMLLDIEVSAQRSTGPTDESIWDTLDRLSELKNRAFFSSLTDEGIALLKSRALEPGD